MNTININDNKIKINNKIKNKLIFYNFKITLLFHIQYNIPYKRINKRIVVHNMEQGLQLKSRLSSRTITKI